MSTSNDNCASNSTCSDDLSTTIPSCHKSRKAPTKTEYTKINLPFPIALHALLDKAETNGKEDIVSFTANGKAFMIHKPTEFVEELMPGFFKTTKIASFQRQLLLYGFQRFVERNTVAKKSVGYYHYLFVKGQKSLSLNIKRKTQGRSSPPFNECPATPPIQQLTPPVAPPKVILNPALSNNGMVNNDSILQHLLNQRPTAVRKNNRRLLVQQPIPINQNRMLPGVRPSLVLCGLDATTNKRNQEASFPTSTRHHQAMSTLPSFGVGIISNPSALYYALALEEEERRRRMAIASILQQPAAGMKQMETMMLAEDILKIGTF